MPSQTTRGLLPHCGFAKNTAQDTRKWKQQNDRSSAISGSSNRKIWEYYSFSYILLVKRLPVILDPFIYVLMLYQILHGVRVRVAQVVLIGEVMLYHVIVEVHHT
jgi:hypothetical protein